jgi:hypothetical protein
VISDELVMSRVPRFRLCALADVSQKQSFRPDSRGASLDCAWSKARYFLLLITNLTETEL